MTSECMRATVVLNTRPLPAREKELAALVVQEYAADEITEYAWEISDFLPANLPDDVADGLIGIRHAAGENSCYMIVWMA